MQWSLEGTVNWTAPRRLALAFTPALGGLVIAAIALGVLASGAPRAGQEGFGAPIILIVGLGFVAVHVLHLRLIDRALR